MNAPNEVKADRRYTKDHEWAKREGDEILVGITAFAVDQLGDITLVSVEVEPGQAVEARASFGTIESVKTLSDLFAPVSGTVTRLNPALEDHPELVNEDCWEQGWMVAIQPQPGDQDFAELLDPEAYRSHLAEADA